MTVSGIHGSASIAIVKDVLILGLAIFLGTYLPLHYFGGIGEMFTRIDAVHPELLRMPEHGFNLSWYNSTTAADIAGLLPVPSRLHRRLRGARRVGAAQATPC